MDTNNFKEIIDEYKNNVPALSEDSRFIRNINENCWISCLHRRTGFGWMEWETALCMVDPDTKETSIKIIGGDHREELNDVSMDAAIQYFKDNEHNKNSFDKALDLIRNTSE